MGTNPGTAPIEYGDIVIPASALFGDELALRGAFVLKPRHLPGEARHCFDQVVHLCWLVRGQSRGRSRRQFGHDCAGRAPVLFGRERRDADYGRAYQYASCEGLSLRARLHALFWISRIMRRIDKRGLLVSCTRRELVLPSCSRGHSWLEFEVVEEAELVQTNPTLMCCVERRIKVRFFVDTFDVAHDAFGAKNSPDDPAALVVVAANSHSVCLDTHVRLLREKWSALSPQTSLPVC